MKHSAREGHWARVYGEKAPDRVSWYQAEQEPSLQALDRLGVGPASSIIDVGGGASNLVDALLERGWNDLTVLDIAASALEAAKARLGPRAERVDWVAADILDWRPKRKFDVWHDRAVFHFLIEPKQRQAYRAKLLEGLAQGGLLIMATFALDGPEKCSGLPVQRYDPESLARELGPRLKLVESWKEEHITPWKSVQAFNWCAFQLVSEMSQSGR